LLGGKALQDAEEWAKDKNLSYQDKQFLAASREKEIEAEIAAKNKEAELEREKKDREAAEQRTHVLSEANIQAKSRIQNGTIVLVVTLLGALTSGVLAWNRVNEANIRLKVAVEAEESAKEAKKKAQQETIQLQSDKKDAERKTQQIQQGIDKQNKQVEILKKNATNWQQQAENLQKHTEEKNQDLKKARNDLQLLGDQKSEIEIRASEALENARNYEILAKITQKKLNNLSENYRRR
jgi:hypothetical protein